MRGRGATAAWLAWRSIKNPSHHTVTVRSLSSFPSSFAANESLDEFEQRIFGGGNSGNTNSATSSSFFDKLGRLENAHKRRADNPDIFDENFDGLSDRIYDDLQQAALYFDFDEEEVNREDYAFRPDMTFRPGTTYDIKDLDLTKPGVTRPRPQWEFEVTTEEVLKKADFRNVRFLANFITEAGIIIKRSKTGISAKAQRKVAREIKTARAFGLLPFTTMGTKSFVYGRTMEDHKTTEDQKTMGDRGEDLEYDNLGDHMIADANENDTLDD